MSELLLSRIFFGNCFRLLNAMDRRVCTTGFHVILFFSSKETTRVPCSFSRTVDYTHKCTNTERHPPPQAKHQQVICGRTGLKTLYRTRGIPQPRLSAAARLGRPARPSGRSADCTTRWSWSPRPGKLTVGTSAVPRVVQRMHVHDRHGRHRLDSEITV